VWSYGPSIIPLQTTVWIVVGIVLTYWVFVPVSFFSGLAAWPTSFSEFDRNGSYYNTSEGHYNETGDPVYLSGVGMTMYACRREKKGESCGGRGRAAAAAAPPTTTNDYECCCCCCCCYCGRAR
jgi:hypothetical protein